MTETWLRMVSYFAPTLRRAYRGSHTEIDGVHLATGARDKIANQLLNFFKTDSIAKRWFLKP